MSKRENQTYPAQSLPLTMQLADTITHIPLKRAFDILFSLTVLFVFLPLLFVIAVAIRLSSGGSIVYAHERIGRGGRPFHCYKFRTMFRDADKRLQEILAKDASLRAEWEESHKLKDDPRITPIGKFLRKTSLDEFPQFWNVLIGDMSVVGPRPMVRDEIIRRLGSKAKKILSVRPGLTGLWQVSGRSNTSYTYRIELDELYVKNRSFWLDLKLVAKTIPCMIAARGAY